MKYIIGNVHHPLSVNEDLSITGAVTQGLSVGPGISCFVVGSLSGLINGELDASLFVAGKFFGEMATNEGVVGIAGRVTTPMALLPGVILVSVGSLAFIHDEEIVIDSGGNFTPSSDMHVDWERLGDEVLGWDGREQLFHGTAEETNFRILRQILQR